MNIFPAQDKLLQICMQLKDTFFTPRLDTVAEVNMLIGFGNIDFIVKNMEKFFFLMA